MPGVVSGSLALSCGLVNNFLILRFQVATMRIPPEQSARRMMEQSFDRAGMDWEHWTLDCLTSGRNRSLHRCAPTFELGEKGGALPLRP